MIATASSALELTAERDGKRHRVTVKQGGTILHMHSFHLSSATARTTYIDALAAKCGGIDRDDRDDLDNTMMVLAATGPAAAPTQGAEGEPDRLAGTPQDIIAKVNTLLADPKLVPRIADDIEAVGVAGERELTLTVYLIGVSRLLPRPLAGIIRGSSSSGKSYTVEKVASLFPPECLIHATQMTPQALFHMKPGSLVHRWVVAGERSRLEDDDRAEATRALREMIASGKLSKLMPTKTGSGIETQTIEQAGPIAFTETTTLTTVFEEDANRCLMLQTDETPEQTRRILTGMAARQAGTREDTGRVVSVHHTLQRMLPRAAVVRVPWADRLADKFACDRVEVRRAFPQLLALVQASALLHHKQRDIGDDGAILADARDYHLARRLIAKPFAQSLDGGLSESALRFLAMLPRNETFTAKGIAKQLKVSQSSVKGWLRELHDAGAVEAADQQRGNRAAQWRLTGKTPDAADELLPTIIAMFPKPAARLPTTSIP